MVITITMMKQNCVLKFRDITQAYPQSSFELNRKVFARLPKEFRDKYPRNTIIQIICPFYGIAESGVHWWFIYHKHYLKELNIITSIYDPCLLIISDGFFGITGMQTDDTLIICSPEFFAKEEEKIQKAAFRAKPKARLAKSSPMEFNGTRLTLEGDQLYLRQKGQSKKLKLVDAQAEDRDQ
jgi:hypothetical protein